MKENIHRCCENCKFWFCNDRDMMPKEDLHKIPGYCGKENLPSNGQLKMPNHGTKCKGFEIERVTV